MFDQSNSIVRRPALVGVAHAELTAATIHGIHYSPGFSAMFIVVGGELWKLTNIAATATKVSGASSIGTSLKPVICDGLYNGAPCILVCAGGNLFMYYESPATFVNVTSSYSAPSACNSVAFMDGYTIVGTTGNTFYWSNVLDITTWNALSFATADMESDKIKRLVTRDRKIWIFGEKSIEAWYNDGTSPFSRLDGAEMHFGTYAPQSIINAPETFTFMSGEGRIISMNGNTYEVLSMPIDYFITNLNSAYAANTRAMQLNLNGARLLLFDIASHERTYYDSSGGTGVTMVYDMDKKVWMDWSKQTAGSPLAGGIGIGGIVHNIAYNEWVGFNATQQKLFYLSKEIYADDWGAMYSSVVMPFMNHGTHYKKRSRELKIKTAKQNGATQTSMDISWRNSADDSFSTARTVTVPGNGEAVLRRNGMFINRQYKVDCSTNTPFVLSDVREVVDPMVTT